MKLSKIIKIALVFIFIFNLTIAHAGYVPIPEELSKKYKTDIERVIKKEIPKSKCAIRHLENEIKTEKIHMSDKQL